MKKLLYIPIILLLFWGQAWGATGYIRNNSGDLEYTSNGDGCSYTEAWGDVSDDYGANDIEEYLKDAIQASGTCYVCGSEYDNSSGSFTDGEIDADDNSLHFQANDQTLEAVGTVTLTTTSGTRVINGNTKTGITIKGFHVISPDDDNGRFGIYINGANSTVTKNTVQGPGVGAAKTGHIGIYCLAANPTISNNTVYDYNVGIKIYEDSNPSGYAGTVSGNTVYNMNVGESGNADCISVSGTAVRDFTGLNILNNTCYGFLDDGIDLYYASNATVDGNYVYTPLANFEANGIKCGSADSTGNIIKNNKIWLDTATTQGAGTQAGIHTNSCSGGKIFGNLIYGLNGTSGYGIKVDDNDWTITNNTVQAEDRAISCGNGLTGLTIQNNIFDGQDGIDFKTGTATITGGYNCLPNDNDVSDDGSNYTNTDTADLYATDPYFVSATDFNLQNKSPCINAGVDPFSDGDGDQYDLKDRLVWSDDTDAPVGPWGDGVDIGAYGDDTGPAIMMGF